MEVVEGRATVEDVEKFVARLGAIGDEHDCTVQAFDARYIVSRAHLDRALSLADRTRERGEAVARERAVEILLYAAGRRQIERALELGVDEGEGPVVVLVAANEGNGERAAATAVSDLLEPADTLGAFDDERVREFYDIGERELAATDAGLASLVLERVALLDVEK
jgi:KEOPS complex subunit Cgi121